MAEGDKTQGATAHSVARSLTALWVGSEHCGEEDYTFEPELPA